MIDFDEAFRLVQDAIPFRPVIKIPLEDSLGFYLAENLLAPDDIPFDNVSAVDGYAISFHPTSARTSDSPLEFSLAGMVKSGDAPSWNMNPGEGVRIFTGAPLPTGADAVIMQEDTTVSGNRLLTESIPTPGENIRFAGEDLKRGSIALEKGTHLTPPAIGLLASMGYAIVPIRTPPSIAILSTGNELIKISEPLRKGKIRDSNTPSLKACLKSLGISPETYQSIDDKEALRKEISTAIQKNNILLVSGGMSVGDYDLCREVLSELGFEEVFWKVRIKPGKPVYLGIKGNSTVVGIPGNPVSSLIVFHTLIRPALIRSLGGCDRSFQSEAIVQTAVEKKVGRMEFIRGIAENLENKNI
ncbi:MAG: molybdopterin molybdotransferase MoeA, partial [Leptospirales bacterium]